MSDAHSGRPSGWVPEQRSGARPSVGAAALLRPLARRVHFVAGILVAPFLLVLCLTGLVYVFSPQIHDDLYGRQLFVHHVGAAPRPVAEQVAAALTAHPEAGLRSVVPPSQPDRTTRVNLSVPGLAEPGEARTVFVDPYTNYVSGELTTLDGRMPANAWLRHLHADLHLGEVGRLYAEIAASWLPVIVLGGLVLWVGKQGRRRRSPRELLVPVPRGNGEQARMRAVHGPLGIWLTVGLLVMSVTGLMMSRFAGWGLFPAQVPTLAAAPVPVRTDPIGVDRVLQVARTEGLGGELEVVVPVEPGRPFTVAERSPGLPVQRDSIAVDPYTAEVTERIGWSDYPFLAQVRELGVQLHTGTLFGLVNQVLLALLTVAAVVLLLVGYRMWWRRSPYRGALPPVPPPALRRLTAPVGVPVVLVAVVLAWLMPAFGVSLVAFVVVDLLIAAVRQRRERVRRTLTAGALLVAGSLLGAAVLVTAPSPVSRSDASGTHPDQHPPGATTAPGGRVPGAVTEQPAPADRVAPGGPPTAGEAAQGSRPGPARSGVPAGAGAPTASAAPAGAERSVDPGGERAAGADARDSGGPGVSGGTGDDSGSGDGSSGSGGIPDGRPGPPPAAEDPPAEDPVDEDPGIVDGLVGALSEAAEPVTSYLLGTVDRAAGGLLGG